MELETCYILCRSYFPSCEFLIGSHPNDGCLFVILDGNPIIMIRIFTLFYRSYTKEEETTFTIADEWYLNNVLREAKRRLES